MRVVVQALEIDPFRLAKVIKIWILKSCSGLGF